MPLGDRFTWPSASSGAVATKNIGWRRRNAARRVSMVSYSRPMPHGRHQGMATPQDEGRHEPGGEQLWNESWYFDFAAEDGSIGGYVRLGLYPALGVAWYWGYLVREGEQLLAVQHHSAKLPSGDVLEVREDGLWSQLYCETPNDHWTVGLEAFAVGLDSPGEAYASDLRG